MNQHWTVKLKDVAEIERRGIDPSDIVAGTTYVGLEHISSGGESLTSATVGAGELGSTKFKFTNDHILYGKLRPYLAKIVAPEFGGVCSTDILPIRPGPKVDKRYLLHFLRLPVNVAWAAGRATGVNLPRLSPSELADLSVPLPPLDEQRRIAAILDKADALRQKRKRAVALLDSLTQSIFLEMFGDQLSFYPEIPLGELTAEAKIGLVRSSTQFGPQFSTPYIRMDAIGRDGRMHLSGVKNTGASMAELSTYQLSTGDFLFNTRNSRELVGKSAVFNGPGGMVYNNNILRMRFLSRLNPHYLASYLQTREGSKKLDERKSGTTSVFAIYQKALEQIRIPLPPTDAQEGFASRVLAIEGVRATHRRQLSELSVVFCSLQHRAFSGQL